MSTKATLVTGREIYLQEDPKQVAGQLGGSSRLVPLTRQGGGPDYWVSPGHVVLLEDA